jgi:Flp pilus assembly protein TadG
MGFLTRLARDVRGNTLAIMAAALIPLAGLIGGGVDMSRLYLVKTRLQQACDAGALAGRKAMAAGSWTTGSGNGSTNDKAEKMFATNFSSGQYGSGTLTKAFTESNGIVTGTAGVAIPMTIMKVFGMTSRSLSVTCQAKMELPNTDVMFVLDMTASMQDLPSCAAEYCGNGVNGSRRIDGLKKAVKCFYEALEKVSTPEPCTYSGGTYTSTGDPTATSATTTAQVRIGFVPYGVNVNVGKVLPNAVMADNWVYQSRVANTVTKYAYTLGTESAVSGWGSWSPTSTPSSFNTSSGFSGFTTPSSDVTVGSTLYSRQRTDINNQTNCDNTGLNNLSGSSNTLVAREDLPGTIASSASVTTPTYPATSQTLTYTETDPRIVNGYRYKWKKNGFSSNSCWLEKASGTYDRTRTGGTSTKTVTWDTANPYVIADGTYTYRPVLQPVNGLKTGGSNWANSVAIPNVTVGTTTLPSPVYLSGSTSLTSSIQTPASATVTWDGCIEEARTFQNTDGNATDDWGTLPASAYDLNVNLIPNGSSTNADWGSAVPSTIPWLTPNSTTAFGPGTYWGPMLAKTSTTANSSTITGAVWVRTDGFGNWTQNASTTTTSNGGQYQNDYKYICTTSPARKLAEYRTNTNFLAYVNALDAQDIGTYHDIGMLWGARFISPNGIFASENAQASTGGAIQRHLIFMTDGGTNTVWNNYNAYGLSYFNRYQFSADVNSDETKTDDAVNARLIKICSQVKNMNIQLWVVSYGASVNTTTQTRLQSCATDANHFFSATDTPTLIANFQAIAAKISALRLTG